MGLNVEGFHRILPLALIALLVWQLLMLVWSFLPASSVGLQPVPPTIAEKAEIKTDVNMESVVSLDLFGLLNDISDEPKAKPKVVISAPETALDLKLKGIYKSDGLTPSSVIIEGSDKKQSIYFEGGLLHESIRLKVYEIHPKHVILERGEQYEKLVLFGDLQKQKLLNESNLAEDSLVQDVKPEETITPTIDQTQNDELTKKMTEIVKVLQNDPISLKGAMVVQAVESNGVFQGYKVSPGDDTALFTELGFRKGDVVTAINNIELDSTRKIMTVLGTLSTATEIEIKTLRDNQPLAFRYSVSPK